jgi:hypothetical protein
LPVSYTQKRPTQQGADIHTPPQQTKHPHKIINAAQLNQQFDKILKVLQLKSTTRSYTTNEDDKVTISATLPTLVRPKYVVIRHMKHANK